MPMIPIIECDVNRLVATWRAHELSLERRTNFVNWLMTDSLNFIGKTIDLFEKHELEYILAFICDTQDSIAMMLDLMEEENYSLGEASFGVLHRLSSKQEHRTLAALVLDDVARAFEPYVALRVFRNMATMKAREVAKCRARQAAEDAATKRVPS